MAIIVEGFDNSGKSTLAQSFGLDVQHPGPAPRNKWDEFKCLQAQAQQARLPIVMDRVTCISSQVYGGRLFEGHLKDALHEMLATQHCVLIYCRPPIERITDFNTHAKKGYDRPSDEAYLKKNAVRLVAQYDQLMNTVPHMRYDWTDPDPEVTQVAFDSQFTIGAWRRCQEKMRVLSQA